MFKEQMNKFKSLILKKTNENTEDGKANKRKIENLVVFLIILIITLIAINTILGNDKEEKADDDDSHYKVLADTNVNNEKENSGSDLEKRLENILETMVGVRKS